MNKRLIIRPGALGDCILALAAMEHLADAEYAEFWVPRPVVPLVQFGSNVRAISSTGLDMLGVGVLPIDSRLASCLQSFDHIVSWYGANRPEFQAAIQATGVPCDFHSALPPLDYGGHASDFFADQVGASHGLQSRIRVNKCGCRDSLVIHPFSGSRRKNWPLESFQQLASSLKTNSLKTNVEWCAGPEETLPGAKRLDDLGELAQWIAGARLYIGNDSGITHLAAATGVPVVAIFVNTRPDVWSPRGENVRVLQNPTVEQATATVSRLLG